MILAEYDGQEEREYQRAEGRAEGCAENDTLHNMPLEGTPELVYAAILAADWYGKYFLCEA